MAWAYVGAVIGVTASVAGNVADSFVPPSGVTDPSWRPHDGSVIGAVFWPVALLVAIEIWARTDWPDGRRWTLARYGGLAPVAVVAAVVSYRHMSGLLAYYGEDHVTVILGPLAVDGLMVMAATALIGAHQPERSAQPVREPLRVLSWLTTRRAKPEPDRPTAFPVPVVRSAPLPKPTPINGAVHPHVQPQVRKPRARRGTDPAKRAEAVALVRQGMTYAEASRQAKVPEPTVRRWAKAGTP